MNTAAHEPRSSPTGGLTSTRRPRLIVFDVNETLSDTSAMFERFADVGAPGHLFDVWFAGLLRDGFALTSAGTAEPFATIGSALLANILSGTDLDRPVDYAVDHIMSGFTDLDVHPDVVEGITELARSGTELVTLSNGSTDVARALLGKAGIADSFDAMLSVEAAGRWKPHADAYRYALTQRAVAAEDAMLVAVHPWDIDGARRAGMSTAWINRNAARYPSYFSEPDVEATSIAHLARLLSGS
ncbi:haloacid dehalogenase type II [Rhodococcus sp. NPDC078407]|uniref:haloacid dehalogenase type II n=1 Tax=Rhodococcus sp. NPDC078407 TaxID=3364509 RepID=UPI0037CB4A6F